MQLILFGATTEQKEIEYIFFRKIKKKKGLMNQIKYTPQKMNKNASK